VATTYHHQQAATSNHYRCSGGYNNVVKTHIECGASQIKAKLKNKTILCCDISGSGGGEFEV
jgi:hypothetical protein